MLKLLILELIKNYFTPKAVKKCLVVPVFSIILMIVGIISIVIVELYLADFAYKYMVKILYYSEVGASLATAILFLIQVLFISLYAYFKVKNIEKSYVETSNRDNAITSFVKGFKNSSKL